MAKQRPSKRYGMAIDLDRCNGCGACMVACAVENNVAPARAGANSRNGVTWLRLYQLRNAATGAAAFVPISCQQCGDKTPCVSVCPQQAVEVDPHTGIVGQVPERCLGCRYCMAACPFEARYFEWWDPAWPGQIARTLNPDVAPRMRGVVSKCNFCHGRLHQAEAKAAAAGAPDIDPADYVPACVEACPAGAIVFGDLNDKDSAVARLAADENAFRLLETLGTGPKVSFVTRRDWVRRAALGGMRDRRKEQSRG
jgi:Fe-S-cluster-containing dehydrogenase component